MIRKIKLWWGNRKLPQMPKEVVNIKEQMYTYEQLVNVYKLAYNDGKRDGLAIARDQATKSLKEILWQQNKQNPRK